MIEVPFLQMRLFHHAELQMQTKENKKWGENSNKTGNERIT